MKKVRSKAGKSVCPYEHRHQPGYGTVCADSQEKAVKKAEEYCSSEVGRVYGAKLSWTVEEPKGHFVCYIRELSLGT